MSDDPAWMPPYFRKHLATATARQVELRRAGDAVRHLITSLVTTEAPEAALAALADDLEAVSARWAEHPSRPLQAAYAEASVGGDVHAFLDDSPLIGRANPIAPPLELHVEEQEGGRLAVVGTVTFGPQYEGPPGHVHGGLIAAAFDELLGMAQSLSGNPGMTGSLQVSYRSPTPLGTELRLIGWVDRVEGRKIFTSGTIHVGERLCAQAEGLFISVDFAKIAAMAAKQA